MNRPLWSFSHSPSGCDTIEPLLPLYADGIASPSEIRLVEAHLPGCAGCRAELSWIQATHAALASRPVAVPPPDLHGRIAQAIAASSAAPVTLRPARVFSLRPAYAAAASLTAAGIAFGLSYSLWHTPSQTIVKPVAPPQVAKSAPMPVVKTRLAPKTIKLHALVASNTVKARAVKHLPVVHQTPPVFVAPTEHIAKLTPKQSVVPFTLKTPVHHLTPNKQVASAPPAEKHPLFHTDKITAPKHTEPEKVAALLPKEPVHVNVEVKAPIINVDPPAAQVASNTKARTPESRTLLGPAVASALRMQTVGYKMRNSAVRHASQSATDMMYSADTGRVAYIDAVHGDQ